MKNIHASIKENPHSYMCSVCKSVHSCKWQHAPNLHIERPVTPEMKHNRVQITPLPPATRAVEPEARAIEPEITTLDTSPQRRRTHPLNSLNRPKRLIKPTLKVLENMENSV